MIVQFLNDSYFDMETRIFVGEEIALNEYEFYYGKRKDEKVTFIFYNFKKDRITETVFKNYRHALEIAREKTHDKRCNNFEYYINVFKS